ncbi:MULTISPECIES: asparagine synthase-related protein [Bacillus cereus group]|uniref:asparagine synthase-related protein n=1 Tax=Bacillus cereus group TaxID=86661 RepID=UPI001C0397DD|nr:MULTISPECIES: asparagine synthase-related protein [Bacillus cereus group]MDM5463586.1 lasso peptide isopeptide bond-forming cyclase [Bacillus cereus]QWH38579.1 lasso peptide isopeptide bond-forming cyclase [Bacillus mycoides]QWI50647.1 lasso peptide isopeptide bond-forming cyclase [Bacillus mycoides]WJE18692.1 lasso peptide isopeptide bond-forming cyclase [Bacillus cereus]
MSAITGILHFNDEPISIEHGTRLMKDLQKYPADDVQIWHTDNVFLGCHAQWITPESIGEQLPFYDYKRQLAITADAIIDNRDELFERLQVEYADRKKMTDSELILLSYQRWKEETPKYLVGDFAFMIWDERKQKLFGARDFSGSRTLYYYKNQQRFAFCTTIQPLLTLPYVRKQLNEQWLAEYLAISGMVDVVDATMTPYKNIEQVPPSHSISIVEDKIILTRYCTLTSREKLKLKSDEEYVEAFQDVFQDAVTARLRTYRHVGAQLSGGLDSGSVVSFAAKVLRTKNKRLHTYSYVPPSDFIDFTPKYRMANERPFIQSTVEHIEGITDHYVDFQEENPLLEINDFLETMEMPYKFFENSIWLKGIFEKAHEEGIGVLLTGGRGNLSISWGPAIEYYAILLKKLKWIRLYKELNLYSKNIGVKKTKSLSYIWKFAFPLINKITPGIEIYRSPRLISPELAKRTDVFTKLKEHGIDERGNLPNIYEERRRHFEELFHWNATNTLGAKQSLRYSLWKRDPTNDIRVIRFCLSVPEEQYVQDGFDRALIRRATESFLPDKVRLNQHYRGVQGVDWVHRMTPSWHIFVEELQCLSSDMRIWEFLNEQVVKSAISKVREGPRPEYATNPEYRIAIRSLVVSRFIKNFS